MQNIDQNVRERRTYPRFIINSEMTFTVADESSSNHGYCRNLSHTGILFTSVRSLSKGDSVNINLQTRNSNFAPLKVRAEVLRVGTAGSEFEIAGKILEYK